MVCRDYKVYKALKGRKAKLAYKEILVSKAVQDYKEPKVLQAHKVILVVLVFRAYKGFKVLKVKKVKLVHKVDKVL